MRYRDGRRSVCLSSQSGCPLTCTFCATGQMQFRRNLDAWEILDQALHFRRIEPLDHAVFMGMGEPMLNLDAVLDGRAQAPGDRDHAPADDDLDGRLAARADAVRRRGDRADPARDLAARRHRRAPQRADAGQRPLPARGRARRVPPLRRASPAQGVRRVRHARGRQRLARARARARRGARPPSLQGEPDPVQPDRACSTARPARRSPQFKEVLDAARQPSTIRLTRGRDIAAACGQLAAADPA